jgi:axial budding pattern protein 2
MRFTGLLGVLALSARVLSTPYVGFPFQEQLPTVARVDQAYTFQISNETFLSSISSVTYSATGLPSWLTFNQDTRTIQGTPSAGDVSDSVQFTLTGDDSEGSISSVCTIVVSISTGPQPSENFTVLNQLATFGQTNGYDSLVLSPGEVFNITFDTKTFDSDDTIVAYYGRSVERSPLPNWLFFDQGNLRFSGVAPPANSEIAPGLKYSFRLFATDYSSFAGNYVDFGIIVGAHDLTTTMKDVIHINGSSGDVINYEIPLSNVYQDGEEVTLANISNVVLQGSPDWTSLNNYTLSGTVPDNFNSTDVFNVTLYDYYSDAVTLFFEIEVISSLFAVSSFRSVNATRGNFFQYYFLSTDFTDYSTTNISVGIEGADWMTFHEGNLTINGETPDDFDSAVVTVTASNGKIRDELSFEIYGVDPIVEFSSSSISHSSRTSSSSASASASDSASASTSSSSTATASATESISSPVSKGSSNDTKALAIGLGVGIPLFLILVAGILIFCLCVKRRSKKTENDDEEKKSPKISPPILGNPANGPTGRSPQPSPENNEPQRLGALNVLKLDEKEYFEHGSTTSSTTNVASFESVDDESRDSLYHDALQAQSSDYLVAAPQESSVPKRSWRQTVDSKINRESLNSLATVSTNELFSIRLAEDDDIKRDPRKSSLNFRDSAFLDSTVSSILTRDDSGNIKKLDSDGNIVELTTDSRPQRASKATNLDVLREEVTPNPNDYGNLEGDVSFTTAHSGSTGEEFYPIQTDNGGVQWQEQSQFTFDKSTVTRQQSDSKAKLRNFTNKGRSSQADISNDTTQSTGEVAEIESL